MGAYCTDFVKKAWPLTYRGGKKIGYPSEGARDEPARPAGGYIWDKCAEAGVSYRSYGEYGRRVSKKDGNVRMEAAVPGLVGHICPDYGVPPKGKKRSATPTMSRSSSRNTASSRKPARCRASSS